MNKNDLVRKNLFVGETINISTFKIEDINSLEKQIINVCNYKVCIF